MTALDRPSASRSWLSANLIAFACGVLIVSAAIGLFYLINRASTLPTENLSNIYFGTTIARTDFSGSLIPDGWRTIGSLPLDFRNRVQLADAPAGNEFRGGGVIFTTALPPDSPYQLDATFKVNKLTNDIVPQLFVSDQPDFDTDRGTSRHELMWAVRDSTARVLTATGQLVGSPDSLSPGRIVNVRIIVGTRDAVVVSNGRTIYDGPHFLLSLPRTVGFRWLAKNAAPVDAIVLQSLTISAK